MCGLNAEALRLALWQRANEWLQLERPGLKQRLLNTSVVCLSLFEPRVELERAADVEIGGDEAARIVWVQTILVEG